jgi:predicted AAA+ superfamily ATPase
VVIDEVQRVPDLLLSIKQVVDSDPRPGQFLLAGSSNVRTNRRIKDALTGRMETLTLWPLAQAEIEESAGVVDALFGGCPPLVAGAPVGRDAFAAIAAAGGFPEARSRSDRRRTRWFANYIDTTLDRGLRDISDAQRLDEVPHLLRLLAAQSAGIVNYATLADRLSLDVKTVKSYIALLETAFIVLRLPSWRPGLGARELQAPKLHLSDSGLLVHLLGADEARVRTDDQVTGRVLESFVVMEIVKQLTASATDAKAYHYRSGRDEIDLVLESRAGSLVGVEVKAGASLGAADWRALAKVRDAAGDRFACGVIFYCGAQTLPLTDRLWAVPISGLWPG